MLNRLRMMLQLGAVLCRRSRLASDVRHTSYHRTLTSCMPWTVRSLTGSRSMAFVQVNRHVELSVGDRDCPLLSPGACPRCAPDGALVTALAPPVVEGTAGEDKPGTGLAAIVST